LSSEARHPSNVISGVLRSFIALVSFGVCVGGIAANGAVVMLAFTWQSNFMIAASFAWTAWALLRDRRTPPEWLAGSAVFYIVITGLVYNFVLNPGSFRVGNYVIAGLTGSDIAHVIVPVAAAVVWLVFEEHRRIPWRYIGLWLTYLVGYLVLIIGLIALVRGVRAPYPFLDVAVIGWAGVLGECLQLLLAFGSLAAIIVATDRWLPPRTRISEHDRFDEFNKRLVRLA
jgi:hypothetical protein